MANKIEEIKRAKDGLDVLDDIYRYAELGFEAIDPDDLDLKGAKITGISFIVNGGKANWDLTRFVPAPKNLKQNTGFKGPNN